MASGAMEAAYERRLHLPVTFAISGFDNSRQAFLCTCALNGTRASTNLLEAPTLPSLICPEKLPEEEPPIFLGQAM